MNDNSQFYLVNAKVMPEVFLKVVRVKKLLAQGKAKNLSQATQCEGLSRSAYYKYKDCVFLYENQMESQIATVYAELLDEPGVLSNLLTLMGSRGANILTINQNIPIDGVAPVSISIRTNNLEIELESWIGQLKSQRGIVEMRILSR